MFRLTARRRRRLLLAFGPGLLLGGLGMPATTALATQAPPVVTSIFPTGGSECGGTRVTISGSNLQSASEVDFGTTAVTTFASDSSTAIVLATPAHDPGPVVVTVVTPGGSATTAYTFTDSAPNLTGINPNGGTTAGGTSVTITGTCFVDATNIKEVDFGAGNAASIVSVSGTQIVATTPAHAAGSVSVTVLTNGSTPANSQTSTNPQSYNYIAPPAVTAVSPSQGAAGGGDTISITGSGANLAAVPPCSNITKVTFGGVAATWNPSAPGNCVPASSNTETLKVTSPASATPTQGSQVDVQLWTCNDCGSATNPADVFTYVAPPTVTSVSPNAGGTNGGTVVTLTGTNFVTGGSCDIQHVYFGGTNAATVDATSCVHDAQSGTDSVNVTSPAESAGVVHVNVVTTGGQSDPSGTQASDEFTYAGLFVSSVTPDGGPNAGGNTVQIFGQGFTNATQVYFGSQLNAVTLQAANIVSDGEIDVTAPAALPSQSNSSVDIQVTDGTNTSATNAGDLYGYMSAPTVASLSPAHGSSGMNQTVTITGTSFAADSAPCDVQSITVGGMNVPSTDWSKCSNTSITIALPAQPSASSSQGEVIVTTDGGPSTAATSGSDMYTFDAASWHLQPGFAREIAAGSKVYVLGTDTQPGGYGIWQWTGSGWTRCCGGGGGGVKIAVDQNGDPWVVNDHNLIWMYDGTAWNQEPGLAREIAAGDDGSVYILTTQATGGGYQVAKWNGSSFAPVSPGGLVDLAVGQDGTVWGANQYNQLWEATVDSSNTPTWTHLPGSGTDVTARDLDHGWVIGTTPQPGGAGMWGWNGSSWSPLPGGAVRIAVDNGTGIVWVVNSSGQIYSFS